MKKQRKKTRPNQKSKRTKAHRPALEPQHPRNAIMTGGMLATAQAGLSVTAVAIDRSIDVLLADESDTLIMERMEVYRRIQIKPEEPWILENRPPRSPRSASCHQEMKGTKLRRGSQSAR